MRDAKSWIEAGAATHVGRVRRQNEDSYLVATRRGVWAVADGMGGHEAGDVASRVVVEELGAIAPTATAAELLASCETHMINANSRLKKLGDERGGALIGTTVAVLLIFDTFYAGVWSGDSRAPSSVWRMPSSSGVRGIGPRSFCRAASSRSKAIASWRSPNVTSFNAEGSTAQRAL